MVEGRLLNSAVICVCPFRQGSTTVTKQILEHDLGFIMPPQISVHLDIIAVNVAVNTVTVKYNK